MRLVETYMETGSIAETARRWHTSRNVVRKWVERYRDDGVKGLGDRSRRPHRSPTQTQAQTEDVAVEAKKTTGYGRKRLAWYLRREKGLVLSPHTIRHTLRRNGFTGRKTKRKTFYPAHLGVGGGAAVQPRLGGREGRAGQGGAGNEALGSSGEAEAPPVPVDVPRGADKATVPVVEPRDHPHQRVVLHGTGDAVAAGARGRGRSGVADGLGGGVRGKQLPEAPEDSRRGTTRLWGRSWRGSRWRERSTTAGWSDPTARTARSSTWRSWARCTQKRGC